MKIVSFLIILILFASLVTPTVQNAISMPNLSPQDLYKQSDMVFYGQVISKQAEPNSNYYQIKVMAYYKNTQTSDSITVAGHKPEGGHVSYPQFEVGDRAIFYITKLDGINTILPYSQKAGGACDVHSFLGPEYFGSPDVYRGGYASNPRLLDVNGNAIEGMILTNQEVVLSYDDIWNNYPQARTIPVKISIKNEDNGHYIFNMTQNLQVQACDFAGNLKWNFTPTEIGNYIAKIDVDNKTKITYGFTVMFDATSKLKIIPSPIKQTKSGTDPYFVICKQDLQLVIKSSNNLPACVKPDTAQILLERGWAKKESYYVDPHMSPKVSLYDYFYDGIDKDNTTVSINNRTYYQTALNYTVNNLRKDTSTQFHGVTFGFPDGIMNTPGGSMTILDVIFSDGYEETYGKKIMNQDGSGSGFGIAIPSKFGPPAITSITVLSNHAMPQAGITIYHDKIKLLVSK